MNIQQINIGQYPNDGSGDDLRTAFEKIVGNFSEIDLNVVLSAENTGGGAPIAITTPTNNALRFRTIVSGNDNMAVSYDSDRIILSVSDLALEDLTNVSNVTPSLKQSLVWNGTEWIPATTVTKVVAGNNITISPTTGIGEVTINSLSNIPSVFDFGTLGNITNIFELILQSTSVDFGTIYEQNSLMLDLGGIEAPEPLTPTYSLSFNSLSVQEGNSAILTLTTTNVVNGTNVPYSISGVISSDINGSSLTGNFVVNNNTASLIINTADVTGNKTLTVSLVGIIPAVSDFISIIDTTATIVSGGSPGTITFTSTADGGNMSTSVFDNIFDGGGVLA